MSNQACAAIRAAQALFEIIFQELLIQDAKLLRVAKVNPGLLSHRYLNTWT